MFKTLVNLTRAGVAVCLTPVAAVADVLTLPSSAYDGRPPFGKSATLLKNAAACARAATAPLADR